jgi:hypothetical protein
MVKAEWTEEEYDKLVNHLTVIRCHAQLCKGECGTTLYVKTAEMEFLLNKGIDTAREGITDGTERRTD